MSDKVTKFGQYLAQGGRDGDDKETVKRDTAEQPDRTQSIQPAPEVK